MGKQESVEEESFSGPFVDHPEYTAPVEWKGYKVPDIIRSGNHAEIVAWRRKAAAQKTVFHHFEWLRSHIKRGRYPACRKFYSSALCCSYARTMMLEGWA